MRIFVFLLGFIYFTNSSKSFAQAVFLSDNAQISVLTCGSGQELYAIFGHTGIRVLDPEKGLDVVYNYGTFDFNTSYFYLKFIQGNLEYFMSYSSYQDFLRVYEYENRTIIEQVLQLDRVQKQKLFDQLNQQLFSKDKFYTYKFIHRNCTTMVVDKTESVFDSLKLPYQNHEKLSYRNIINQYLKYHYFERLGINIMFGAPTDEVAKAIFLPNDLLESLKITQIDGKPIAKESQYLLEKYGNEKQSLGWNNIYVFSCLLMILVLLRKRTVDFVFLTLIGTIGLFLSFLGMISEHQEVLWNYNIFFINPILILWIIALVKQKTWVKKIEIIYWLCLGIYLLLSITKSGFITLLPLTITVAYLVFRNRKIAVKN